MVSSKTLGGIIAGSAVAFGGILYYTIRSLSSQSAVLGCVADSPACQSVTTSLSASHLAVGFISALFSLGIYVLLFHKDAADTQAITRDRNERIALISTVMTQGERAVLQAVLQEEGILQSSLAYRTNLTQGRISQVLSGFENRGLIQRTPEGRSYRIYPSV